MTRFQGFKTKEEAKAFIKMNKRGYLTWEEHTPKTKKLSCRGEEYMMAVKFGGLDQKKYPYCVQWNDSQF